MDATIIRGGIPPRCSQFNMDDFSFDEDGIAFDDHPHNTDHPTGGLELRVPRARLNAAQRALVPI